MLQNIIEALRQWAQKETSIESVILVGSWARGTNRPDSDMDLCILTARREGLLAENHFPSLFGKVRRQQTEYYGACTSVRVWYEGGAEIEFGLVEPDWIALPLDEGTRRVLSDGYCVLYDRAGYFDNPLLPQPNNCWKGDRVYPYSGMVCFSKNCCTHSSSFGWMSG